MKIITLFIFFSLMASALSGAVFSGRVENKFGDFIGFTDLTATNQDTTEVIPFSADRGGLFSVDLPDGTWNIAANTSQVAEWGYAPLSSYELNVSGADIEQNIILYASEPLSEPKIRIYKNQFGTISLSLQGQGGTRFIVERSYDLKNWHSYYERTTAKGGLTTSANAPSYRTTVFYRLTAATE